jgi:RNA polymerase sigma-70 factor, ECF subfamily
MNHELLPPAPFSRRLSYIAVEMTVTAIEEWPREITTALERAREGDEHAFGSLVREHESMVYSIAFHALRDAARAEEIAQEVFLQLYRTMERIESPSHLVHWLRRTTGHRVIDEIRTPRDRAVSLELVEEPRAEQRQGDPLLRERLRALVAELPGPQRVTLVLRFGEEMGIAEIAESLGMPLNSVKSHLRRGLGKLRARLGSEGGFG